MPNKEKIYNFDLLYNNSPMPFVIKTMEEIDRAFGLSRTNLTGTIITDPWGNEKVGFMINGKINRKDLGWNWNAALESDGVLVSEDVRISCEIQLVK